MGWEARAEAAAGGGVRGVGGGCRPRPRPGGSRASRRAWPRRGGDWRGAWPRPWRRGAWPWRGGVLAAATAAGGRDLV